MAIFMLQIIYDNVGNILDWMIFYFALLCSIKQFIVFSPPNHTSTHSIDPIKSNLSILTSHPTANSHGMRSELLNIFMVDFCSNSISNPYLLFRVDDVLSLFLGCYRK